MSKQLHKDRVLEIIADNASQKEQLLNILLAIQEESGQNYVSEEWARLVAEKLDLPLSKIYDVLTFYSMFSTKPRGKYVIEICNSAPCYINKSDEIARIFEHELGIKLGETTPDNLFTLMYTSCVGACDIGPVVKIGETVYGNLDKGKIISIINNFREVVSCQK